MFVGVGVGVCKLRKLLVCLLCVIVTFVFSINVLWVLQYKICVIVYCDVVNVQPRFNLSDEIIILNLYTASSQFSFPILVSKPTLPSSNVADCLRLKRLDSFHNWVWNCWPTREILLIKCPTLLSSTPIQPTAPTASRPDPSHPALKVFTLISLLLLFIICYSFLYLLPCLKINPYCTFTLLPFSPFVA